MNFIHLFFLAFFLTIFHLLGGLADPAIFVTGGMLSTLLDELLSTHPS